MCINNKLKIMQKILFTTSIVVLFFIVSACKPKSVKENNSIKTDTDTLIITQTTKKDLSKVIFFLENSESMFGYVNGNTEYIDVISNIISQTDLVTNNISREFYLINGSSPDMSVNYLGNDPIHLTNVLNPDGFRKGDVTKSDLNSMFQLALKKATKDTITVLVSDAIYDIRVDPKKAPGALAIKGNETKENFIKRLNDKTSNTQTLFIKLTSQFNGKYFFISQKGLKKINQSRPYYIWVFGEDKWINKYFSESFITSLNGYDNYARFSENKFKEVKYKVLPSINKFGTFKPNPENRTILENAKPDMHGKGFQFTIGVDYHDLPFSDNYLTSKSNYICSNPNYSISKIKKNDVNIPGFDGSHLISVYTDKNHIGTVEISLTNEIPNWIRESDTEDELKIDSLHTYGLQYLTRGITEAYKSIKTENNIATFNIQITK